MVDYRIVCVLTEHPHRHITTAGTGELEHRATTSWTVSEVRSAISSGDTFHTIGTSSGKRAEVRADDCRIDGCTIKTIRSAADAVKDNNLDNLRTCNFTS